MSSRITLSGNTDPLAVAGSSFDPNFQRLGVRNRAFTMTCRARSQILAGSMTARALHVELHAAARLRDLSGAIAFGTLAWGFERTLTTALRANILARDVQAHHTAADRRPEWNVDLIFEIRPGFGPLIGMGRCAAASTEDSRKDVAKATAPTGCALTATCVVDQVREIESAKIEMDALSALTCSWKASTGLACSRVGFGGRWVDVVRVEPDLIVNLPLLGIAKNFVRLRDSLEFLFGSLVPWIDVGMILAGEFAEGFPNVLGGRGLLHAENLVIVFLGGGRHYENFKSIFSVDRLLGVGVDTNKHRKLLAVNPREAKLVVLGLADIDALGDRTKRSEIVTKTLHDIGYR